MKHYLGETGEGPKGMFFVPSLELLGDSLGTLN